MLPIYLALLAFLWEYEAAPTQFLLTLESIEAITGTQQVLVAGVVPNECAGLPGATEDTYCTTITCPGMGRFRATVEVQGRRSNTITFRVHDQACRQVDGPAVVPGVYQGVGIPPGVACRSKVPIPPTPVGTMDTPSLTPLTPYVATPRTEAPVIPYNPKVVAKVPHAPAPTTATLPVRVPMPPRGLTDPLPTRPIFVPAGPLETRLVTLPPVDPPRVACP